MEALASEAALRHLDVYRQSVEQCDEDEDQVSNRSHRTRCEECDSRLVTESGEVVDTSEPYDLPPGMGRHFLAGVVHGLTSRQPLPNGGNDT